MAAIFFYVAAFIFMQNRLNYIERNDINYLINPREMSGQIFTNTCLHLFPNKVNLEMYRNIMMEQ